MDSIQNDQKINELIIKNSKLLYDKTPKTCKYADKCPLEIVKIKNNSLKCLCTKSQKCPFADY